MHRRRRCASTRDAEYGAFGFVANVIFFPTDGYWEVTGHLDDKTLTFIVQLVKSGRAPGTGEG